MSNLASRLERLTPALSARERFLLEFQALGEGRTPDPGIRSTMPPNQRQEFNHYLGLKNDAYGRLGPYAIVTATLVEKLFFKATGFLIAGQFAIDILDLSELIPASKRRKAEAILETDLFPLDLAWHEERQPGTFMTHVEEVLEVVRRDIRDRWLDVLAIEQVYDEIAEDFGSDLKDDVIRDQLAGAKKTLAALAEWLSVEEPTLEPGHPALLSAQELLAEERWQGGRR